MTDHLDLPTRHREQVEMLLREHAPQAEVWAYRSRVNGMNDEASDLDLVLRGPELAPIPTLQLADLAKAFRHSNIPILVQVHDWSKMPEGFHQEIEREYVVLQKGSIQCGTKSDWRTVNLDQLGRIITGKTPSSRNPEYFGGDILFVTPKDFNGRRRINSTERHLTEKGLDAVKNARIPSGAVMVSCIGSDMGKTAIASEFCVTNQQINTIIVDLNNDLLFVYYNLSCRKEEIRRYAGGSAQPILNKSDFGQLSIDLPPLPEQQAIAYVLGTLDDKIELNRRMNQTLEEMARAVFDSWFLDFDPVRAKVEGHWRRGKSLPGLPADLYDLFPDRLIDSALGPIPEGWKVGTLDDIVHLLSGGTPKTSVPEYWNGDILWYTAKDAPVPSDVFVIETARSVTPNGVANSATRVLPKHTTIVTARGTVGKLACLGKPMAMNQTCYGIRGDKGFPDYFTYLNVKMTLDQLRRKTHGTVFDTITRQTFGVIDSVIPPLVVAKAFETTITPLMRQILLNLYVSQTISTLRDAALPKLLSGECTVE